MEKLLGFLQSIGPISDGLKEALSLTLKVKELDRKQRLLRAGHTCRNIYFIETGLLRCFYDKDGVEVCSWFMQENDVIISIESFFHQQPSYESIEALEDSVVWYVSYAELNELYESYPEFNYIARIILQNYHVLWAQQLYGLRMSQASERYDWLLQHHPSLALRVPAKYIASWLGMAETHFSTIKAKKLNGKTY